ncbi:MAG: response regulator [Opitutaceae bacterium]
MKPHSIRVLLIEDSPSQAVIVRDALSKWKYHSFELTHATTVTAGLALLDTSTFDVCLLDLTLPDSIGEETFEKVYGSSPELPIVVLTSLEDEDVGDRLVQAGAQEFLLKTELNSASLPRILRHAIERRFTQKELEQSVAMLQHALAEVNALSGVIPICSGCKKIRNDKGYWDQVEAYISKHTLAKFSHSLCPECMAKNYPGVDLAEGSADQI